MEDVGVRPGGQIVCGDGRGDLVALDGGDLGWRSASELPPAFVDVADKLAEGETAPEDPASKIVKLDSFRKK